MHTIVTGAAGFIGSAIVRRLIERGDSVIGIDSFLDSYPRIIKEDRVNSLKDATNFRFIEGDLIELDLEKLLEGIDCIFHLAAQAGVRYSWGRRFEIYTQSNILSTQRLLEAATQHTIKRFVYSSSSSVYGDAVTMPTSETSPVQPVSPYAVSKLAGEHLCYLYEKQFGVPTVTLRYFTVYGPKPRPDQAVCIFTRSLLEDRTINMFGDGEQLRGMTYVSDVVNANIAATEKDCAGSILNIGGGTSITMNELIKKIEKITGKNATIAYAAQAKGDARNTFANIEKAKEMLNWQPEVEIDEGLQNTIKSIEEFYYDRANSNALPL